MLNKLFKKYHVIILSFFLILCFFFSSPVLSQYYDDNITVFEITPKMVREGRGESLLHADVLSLEIQTAGYYRIIPKCYFDNR